MYFDVQAQGSPGSQASVAAAQSAWQQKLASPSLILHCPAASSKGSIVAHHQ